MVMVLLTLVFDIYFMLIRGKDMKETWIMTGLHG